jgi:hypothetical protein
MSMLELGNRDGTFAGAAERSKQNRSSNGLGRPREKDYRISAMADK